MSPQNGPKKGFYPNSIQSRRTYVGLLVFGGKEIRSLKLGQTMNVRYMSMSYLNLDDKT